MEMRFKLVQRGLKIY